MIVTRGVQMNLLDRAVKMAAEQDEPDDMNFVRKHAREQAEERGVSLREAACRIFSNASGSYSSNVNLAVENSSWSDEQQLQEMYLARKSFAFNSDRCATLLPALPYIIILLRNWAAGDSACLSGLSAEDRAAGNTPIFSSLSLAWCVHRCSCMSRLQVSQKLVVSQPW